MTDQEFTPRERVERLFAGLASPDADAFADAMAPDAVFEIPWTVPGLPERLEGREAIREHLAQRWAGRSSLRIHGVYPHVYDTTDPELFFAENEVDMTGPDGVRWRGRTSVNLIRVRDGQIVLFRDYMDTGRLATLVAR
ncbi:nuclear transport factor 2 family protein [Nocardia macrotermitis]|uniref:Putative PhzA/B-like protein n=1 Tax=Nocardia macrotermitis TaxID=2585198 RepID=A0A7K0CWV5_9NOCA|nr:nuclear transport factor 2 family protein [Nocardia macrotermitis]MQY17883.1 putative PhzA/B-like protein [Nocardia macrotermitis]